MAQKILVVDDDPVAITLMESRLTKAGFDAKTATTGQMGVNMAGTIVPDCILLDVEMPDMNGYEVIQALKAKEATKNIPIIVITSHEENKPIFMRKGIQDYLVKPVDIDQLIAQLREI